VAENEETGDQDEVDLHLVFLAAVLEDQAHIAGNLRGCNRSIYGHRSS
jgi:hypothetical protein